MKVELDREFWHKMAYLYREGLINYQCLSCDYTCGADTLDELVSYFPQRVNDMWNKITNVVYRHRHECGYDSTPEINKILDEWKIE